MILLDFVGGTHGHFLEVVTNRALGFVTKDFDPFTTLGTSHHRPKFYLDSKQISCDHWFENNISKLSKADKVIRIVFDPDDLLLISSISLLRSSDYNIDNDVLHVDTVKKLINTSYAGILNHIYQSYNFLDPARPDIPRHVLREYFKFGFRDHTINGLWQKQQLMLSIAVQDEFRVPLKNIYDINLLKHSLNALATWTQRPVDTGPWLQNLHAVFLSKIPYFGNQATCDQVINAVINEQHLPIPKLTLMQESYINGKLENIFGKEMPFYQSDYFTNTKDMLQYIHNQAPKL